MLTRTQIESARELIYRGNLENHLEELARVLAPTAPGAPLSDKECNELNVSIYGGVSAASIAVINRILAKRNVQPIPPQSQQDAETCALWRKVQGERSVEQPVLKEQQCDGSCDNDWCTAVPAPTPISSVAQADWNDQHGHRTEILPLIGGDPVKKEKAAPVDSNLAKKAHSAFMSAPDKPWDAVVRVIQEDRDARWEKALRDHPGPAISEQAIEWVRARIEAKPKTLEERIADVLISKGPDNPEQYRAIAAELEKLAKEHQ